MEGTVEKIVTDDLMRLEEVFDGWDEEHTQLDTGPFHGAALFSQVGTCQVIGNYWSNRVYYRGTCPPGAFGMALTLKQHGSSRWMGIDVGTTGLIIQKPDSEAEYIGAPDWQALVVSIPAHEFKRQVAALTGSSESALPEVSSLAQLSANAHARLTRPAWEYLLALAACKTVTLPASVQAMGRSLVEAVFMELVSTLPQEVEIPSRQKQRQLVWDADDLVAAQPCRVLRLDEVCHALRVSERTLHYAFADTLGYSPAHWLKLRRLNRVREKLLHPRPGSLVKQIALEEGFGHLGRFAAEYRAQFGERPSETLSRNVAGFA